jgi:pimeloyl-ACP methyl ester carboxylesterase
MNTATLVTLGVLAAALVILTAFFGWCFLIGILILLWVVYMIGKLWFTDDRNPDEIHYVKTKDGWDIAIWRIRPKTGTERATPILFVHGLGIDQRNFDFNDRFSLSRYLAREGYDCFLPALRGCGPSARKKWNQPGKWDIDFDMFVEQDIPAVIDKVKEITGKPAMHFVGQSMGGMIGYAVAQGEYAPALKSFTSICGPCFFKHMTNFHSMLAIKKMLDFIRMLPVLLLVRIRAPFLRYFPSLAGNEEVNSANVDGDTIACAAFNAMTDIPSRLLKQFAGWVSDGEFGSHKESAHWEKNLSKITTPIYCLVGPVDFFCPSGAIEGVVNQVSSAKKLYRMFSKANGGMADYGHGDLLVGRTAPEEIFPTILSWINEND